jgi:hypothetical protein
LIHGRSSPSRFGAEQVEEALSDLERDMIWSSGVLEPHAKHQRP